MTVLLHVVQALFACGALGLLAGFLSSKRIGLLLGAVAYGGAAIASFSLSAWWPLPAGFGVAWILRFLGADPDPGSLAGGMRFLWKINRIAAVLGRGERLIQARRFDVVASDLFRTDDPVKEAKEALFDLLQRTPAIRSVLDAHGVDTQALRDLHEVLGRRVGGWRGRHYIPVHALAFPAALDFLLRARYQRFAHERFESLVDDVQLRLLDYFDRGAPVTFPAEVPEPAFNPTPEGPQR